MAKSDWFVLLGSAFLVVIATAAHSGELSKADRAAFAIKPEGSRGDVKTRLWSGVNVAALAPDLSIKCDESSLYYPWKIGIVSTVFWVGETGAGSANTQSAWDRSWMSNYGGIDDPVRRDGYEPAAFRPLENPFYVALPYCDIQAGRLKPEVVKVVPWFNAEFRGVERSVCKGRWVEIRHGLRTCFAQWQDVGPFRTDSVKYVFGDDRPNPNANRDAGIDVSPAVRDYLGLRSMDSVDWRFIEQALVPVGPWSLYMRLKNAAVSRITSPTRGSNAYDITRNPRRNTD
ncbi:MAG: hypothetical protein JO251_20880 [Verrucomicrobia bacterium]|nr:hypothetical protein [Verrucomicrobiota bacterium]MBV8417663.1 hypothetical protein [Verrucomicrobiota bacterium]